MGQEQYKSEKGTEATGNQRFKPVNQVDRVGAKFEEPHAVNPAYAKGGTGAKGNPGKPT
jgi:hypothetical protein